MMGSTTRLTHSLRRAMTTAMSSALGSALVIALPLCVVNAQERLVGRQAAGIGFSYENVSFGGNGLRQYNFIGLDSARVSGVQQFSMPLSTAWSLGPSWRVDMTALYANATVRYRDAKSTSYRESSLAGISDVRMRATGTIINDLLVLTAGINLPTGRTSLSTSEFGVLRILAAPSLGLGSAPVGAGASGTMGLIVARRLGPWAMAMGGSYEHRGRYQPIAALVAGAPSSDFRPGGVLRASVTGDRTVGPHRLSVALAADVFSDDELRTPPTDPTQAATGLTAKTVVRLGPVYSSDVQLLLAAPHVRQLLTYASLRWRAPFSRDDKRVAHSSGSYLDTGVRATFALGAQRDLIVGADTRLHAGLGVDEGLPTSGVVSGGLSAGLEVRRGLLSLQPYARAQAGSLRQRAASAAVPSQGFTGLAAGLVAITRF